MVKVIFTTFYEHFNVSDEMWASQILSRLQRAILIETNCSTYYYHFTKTHYKQESFIYPRFEQYWTTILFSYNFQR